MMPDLGGHLLGTPSNSIIVSRVPVGQKISNALSVQLKLKPQKSQNRGSSYKLHSKLKTSKPQKSQTPCQRD